MRTRRTIWGIGPALALSVMLSACTGRPAVVPSSSASSPSITFARYFFSASGIRGVLEVSSSPPSICYSTQSFPARPISIIPGPSSGVFAHAEVSYVPVNGDFCDRAVRPALAAALLAEPSGYQVSWRPRPAGPTAFSSFTSA